jgi:hypothetical protein
MDLCEALLLCAVCYWTLTFLVASPVRGDCCTRILMNICFFISLELRNILKGEKTSIKKDSF